MILLLVILGYIVGGLVSLYVIGVKNKPALFSRDWFLFMLFWPVVMMFSRIELT